MLMKLEGEGEGVGGEGEGEGECEPMCSSAKGDSIWKAKEMSRSAFLCVFGVFGVRCIDASVCSCSCSRCLFSGGLERNTSPTRVATAFTSAALCTLGTTSNSGVCR